MLRLRRCDCAENGAVLFAGCVAGVEGEGKDVETECDAKGLKPIINEEPGGGAEKDERFEIYDTDL